MTENQPLHAAQPSFLTPDEWQSVMAALRLSRREREIMHCFIAEQSDHAIAATLGMKLPTVRAHVERLYRKLHTHNRSGAIVRVFAVYATIVAQRGVIPAADGARHDSGRDDLQPRIEPIDLP